jgi:hypothetical protein
MPASLLYPTYTDDNSDVRLSDDMQPFHLVAVVCLELTVRMNNQVFLLAHVHRYANDGGSLTLHWCLPHLCEYITTTSTTNRSTPQAINKQFKSVSSQFPHLAKKLAHRLGIIDLDNLKAEKAFLQLRPSTTVPGHPIQAYRIIPYSIIVKEPAELLNIADQAGARGNHFIPVPTNVTSSPIKTFSGGSIATNITHLFSDADCLSRLHVKATNLTHSHFMAEYRGLILFFDLAGFGKTLLYTRDHSLTAGTANASAQKFRLKIIALFHQFFADLGLHMSKTSGDGFIAMLPGAKADTLSDLIDCYCKIVLHGLDEMQVEFSDLPAGIERDTPAFGSRLAIHHGSVHFGRLAGPVSSRADFDGQAVVDAARAETALSAYTKDFTDTHPQARHWFAVTAAAASYFNIADVVRQRQDRKFVEFPDLAAKAKEWSGNLKVFAVS